MTMPKNTHNNLNCICTSETHIYKKVITVIIYNKANNETEALQKIKDKEQDIVDSSKFVGRVNSIHIARLTFFVHRSIYNTDVHILVQVVLVGKKQV